MNRLFFLVFFTPMAFGSVSLNEETLPRYIESSPTVMNLKERLSASKKLQGSLTRSFIPIIDLSYGRERFTTGPYFKVNQPYGGVEAKMNIFNSGKDVLENHKRNKEADLARVDTRILKAEVLAESRRTLAQYAYILEVESILKDSLNLNEVNIQGAEKRIRAGLSSGTDSLDFKQQKITLIQELLRVQFEKGVTLRQLAVLAGLSPDEELAVEFMNSHPEHDQETVTLNLTGASVLKERASLLSHISELEMKSAQRWWAPHVDLYGFAMRFTEVNREYPTAGQRNDFTLGFKITLPIFDGGEGIQQASAKEAVSRAYDYQLKQKTLEVHKENLDAIKKLELAHNLIHGAEDNIEIMQNYRKSVLRDYDKGVKNSPDVLQANLRWIEAKTKFAEVKKNYQLARAEALYLKSLSTPLISKDH